MYPNCPYCQQQVSENSKAIECDSCFQWYHFKCSGLTIKQYNHYCSIEDLWFCLRCRNLIFPFNSITDNNLLKLTFNSNTTCCCSKKISRLRLENLSNLEVISSISNVPNLGESDIDEQISHKINFNYYSTHDFHNNSEISGLKNSLSFLHCNIRSLQANYDHLLDMLNILNFDFSVIGLSEIKFKIDKEVFANISIPRYTFIFQPSNSAAGGVGLYINNHLHYSERNDLSNTSDNYESIWIEVGDTHGKNIICSVFYRHPNSSLATFLDDFYKTIDKISKENKPCVIMGDFNIDLINYESHHLTEEYINTLNSFSFQPLIIKPTRITHHSATLIDNIFFNSLDHYTISGNIIYDISDHLPNFLIIDNAGISSKSRKVFKRDYINCDKSALINDFKGIDWTSHFCTLSSVDDLYEIFYSKTTEIVDKHIPLKQLSSRAIKQSAKPWITPAIRTSIKKKINITRNLSLQNTTTTMLNLSYIVIA